MLWDLWSRLAANDAVIGNTVIAQNAIATYASIPTGMGLRHAGFFRLGLTLNRCGLTDTEILAHLSAADTDGSRNKKNAIDSVMKSLKSARWIT